MQKSLTNKNILLAVTGSIAAYKSPDIIRRLQELGAKVRVILTQSGAEFITQQTLQTISKNKIYDNLWDKDAELAMGHIELARWADVVLIAPASANSIAKLAAGVADDLLGNVVLASKAKIFIAPTMNVNMFNHPSTQANLTLLLGRGVIVINDTGLQACGDEGAGRLADATSIAQTIANSFSSTALAGKKIIITAGATQEAIDPVRFISNHSSGKMALALANACIEQGAQVIFIYGALQISLPAKASNQPALSGDEMYQAVMKNINDCDIFIAVAAVADYTIKNPAKQKIKRTTQDLILTLTPNKDILKAVCQLPNKPFCIGFGAHTQDVINQAQQKYQNKGCDLLIANDVSRSDIGFNADDNEVIIFHPTGYEKISKNTKFAIAQSILSFVQKSVNP